MNYKGYNFIIHNEHTKSFSSAFLAINETSTTIQGQMLRDINFSFIPQESYKFKIYITNSKSNIYSIIEKLKCSDEFLTIFEGNELKLFDEYQNSIIFRSMTQNDVTIISNPFIEFQKSFIDDWITNH